MTISLDMTGDNAYYSTQPPATTGPGETMNEENQPTALIADLRKLVERKGLVHRKVASKLGVTVTTFSRWMNGHTEPTSEPILANIARFIKRNS